MEPLPLWAVAMSGGAIGCVIGYSARRGRLCTFSAFEDAFLARNFRRLKVLAIALGIGILLTQMMVISGALAPDMIRYLPVRLAWIGIFLGGLLFGLGMALVGTCAFGSLVRLGSGDLRSLVTLLVYAIVALAALRGWLGGYRLAYLESLNLPLPGHTQADLAAVASWLWGDDLRILMTLACASLLIGWGLSRRDVFKTPRLLTSGLTLGLAVPAAWLVTGVLVDDMALVIQPEGLTFVAPVADVLQAAIFPGGNFRTFGVCSVFGVIAGSYLASIRHDEFRWEAHDDQREMRRHIAGSILMGLGGVLAGGCTIGQGLTAGSVLGLSWFPAVGGMAVGARIGLYLLLSEMRLTDVLPVRFFPRHSPVTDRNRGGSERALNSSD
jgi:uncharacterized membrane protein YedE/YeeE